MRKISKERVESKLLEWLGEDFKLISEYNGGHSKITLLHSVCGGTFERIYKNCSVTKSCPHCSPAYYKLDTETFTKQIEDRFPNITIVGEYVNDRTVVEFRYEDCGHICSCTASNLKQGRFPVCQECSGGRFRQEYKEELKAEMDGRLKGLTFGVFNIVGAYKSGGTPCEMFCHTCETKFTEKPVSLINRGGKCPNCFVNYNSVGESMVAAVLRDLGLNFTRQYLLDGRYYDFYLPDHHLLIEYDGSHHAIDNRYTREGNDEYKDEVARVNDHPILRIAYKQPIIETLIRYFRENFNDYPLREYITSDW